MTEIQFQAARMIAMGIKIKDIASGLSVDRTTIYNWKKLPGFTSEVARLVELAKVETGVRVVRDIAEIKDIVLSTLIDVAQNDASGSARVSAAKVLSEMVEKAEGESSQDSVMVDQSDKIINMLEVIQKEKLALA